MRGGDERSGLLFSYVDLDADFLGKPPPYSGIIPPPCNGMMPPPDSEMIAPPITE